MVWTSALFSWTIFSLLSRSAAPKLRIKQNMFVVAVAGAGFVSLPLLLSSAVPGLTLPRHRGSSSVHVCLQRDCFVARLLTMFCGWGIRLDCGSFHICLTLKTCEHFTTKLHSNEETNTLIYCICMMALDALECWSAYSLIECKNLLYCRNSIFK